ncbi:MAG: GNAT family N-acetyltransferase, partial [Lachnospiraceae bacterium]|nr:GNAT family N-acetyltransferase [Lachnospiraceae bacterium]
MNIRKVTEQDAEALLGIYGYYVEKTAISFEYDRPTVEEFHRRIRDISEHYPYLLIEDEGSVKGYAYAGVFKGRAAYDHCCEVTIYL